MTDQLEQFPQPQLSSKEIIHPENSAGVNFNAGALWQGTEARAGLRQDLSGVSNEKTIQAIDNDANLKGRVVARYQKLLGLLGQSCRQKGIEKPSFTCQNRGELILMAHRIETNGQEFCQRVKKISLARFSDDPEKANLIAEKMIGDYLKTEEAIIDHLVNRIRQQNIDQTKKQKKTQEMKKDPRHLEWEEIGQKWLNSSPDQREEIVRQIAARHQASVASCTRDIQQPNFVYYWLKAHQSEEREKHRQKSKGVNDAQDRLQLKIAQVNAQTPVVNLPTKHLRDVFEDLEIVDNEVKIHLQPQLEQEPMVVDRLLSLLEQQPQLRDGIDAIKVRVIGNGQPEPDGHHLPEVVIYTNNSFQACLLKFLQQEFCDLTGNGLTPRFNQEVANQLIYVAQSGGDLKQWLSQEGLLDKLFDKETNYANLRV